MVAYGDGGDQIRSVPFEPTPPDVTPDQERRRKLMLRYQAQLLELGSHEEVDLHRFLHRFLKADATMLAVERVSYWEFERVPRAIRCSVLYTLGSDRFDGGLRLSDEDAPNYFRAMERELIIVANDARHDERTRDLLSNYLEPAGITSMLDVPVWVRGRLGGVICHEHVGPRREWQPEEQAFALSIGQLVSIALEADERRRSERALRDSEKRYEQAEEGIKLRDDMFSVASHELRMPLTALRLHLDGLVRILERPSVEGTSEELLRKINSATRQTARLTRLINNLLEVSRISSDRPALQFEELDLAQLVRELAEPFRDEASVSGSQLLVRAGEPVVGQWDPLELEQVVTNLISNAIRFGNGRPIEVEVVSEGENARLVVRDHGIGIPEADLPGLFGHFEHAAAVRHYGGLGLGLYVTRRVVEGHQGTITVESQPGQGSTFTIVLPRHPPAARLH